MAESLNWMTADQLAKGFARKQFTPLDAARACLNQIRSHDSKVNAMSRVDEGTALKMARASSLRWAKGKPLSPLDGVPLLIKDLLLVNGWPTLRGSRTVDSGQSWETDAPCVARLREDGCVFLGMTTTPEFGWKGVTDSPLTGITRNPWDLTKTPGGSSGGSSAALAAGYGPLAIGTDGGGSIRIPAGFTGTFGLKPSFGRVPAYPASPFGTVAHVGPMTRSVKDAALMMNVMTQPDARDWFSLPHDGLDYTKAIKGDIKGLRVAFSLTLGYVDVDPEIATLVKAAVKKLKALGAKVTEIDPGFADPADCFRIIWWGGARALLGKLPPEKKALLDPALADVIKQAEDISVDDLHEANRQRAVLGSQMRQFMEDYDVLVTPTLPGTAFDAGQLQPGAPDAKGKWVNWTPYTYPFNLTQQPAASIGCGFTKAGLPAGLHIVGRMFDDATVMKVAAAYESATDFHEKRATGF